MSYWSFAGDAIQHTPTQAVVPPEVDQTSSRSERGRSPNRRIQVHAQLPQASGPNDAGASQLPQVTYIPPASTYTGRSRSRSSSVPRPQRSRASSVRGYRRRSPTSTGPVYNYADRRRPSWTQPTSFSAHNPFSHRTHAPDPFRSTYTGYPPTGPAHQPPVVVYHSNSPQRPPVIIASSSPRRHSHISEPVFPPGSVPYPTQASPPVRPHAIPAYQPWENYAHSAYSYVPDNRTYTSGGDTTYHDADGTQYTSVNPWSTSQDTPSKLPLSQHYEAAPHYPAPYAVYPYKSRRSIFMRLVKESLSISLRFLFHIVPNQLYLHFLLRLPAFYWSRVAQIFEQADMNMAEIKTMAQASARKGDMSFEAWYYTMGDTIPNLKLTWETFIDSLLREWKTLNIISVLLLSAILTLLQINGVAADPITRYCALFSLICALISLLFGCMYIIRFGTMRKPHKAAAWAAEAQNQKPNMWWNVWVLLAMPGIWLAWSIVLYIVCIMSFVWRTGPGEDNNSVGISATMQLGLRIGISATLGLGILYFVLIMSEFRRYGDVMDQSFKRKIDQWARERKTHSVRHVPPPFYTGSHTEYQPWEPSLSSPRSASPLVRPVVSVPPYSPPAFSPGDSVPLHRDVEIAFQPQKIMDLRFQPVTINPMPPSLTNRTFTSTDWERFASAAVEAWNQTQSTDRSWRYIPFRRPAPLRPQDRVVEVIEQWNTFYFVPRQTLAVLCLEYLKDYPHSPVYAIYLLDTHTNPVHHITAIASIFTELPEALSRLDVFERPEFGGRRRRMLGRVVIRAPEEPMEPRVHFPASSQSCSRSRSPRRSQTPTATPHPAYDPFPSSRHLKRRHSDTELHTSLRQPYPSRSSSRSPIPPNTYIVPSQPVVAYTGRPLRRDRYRSGSPSDSLSMRRSSRSRVASTFASPKVQSPSSIGAPSLPQQPPVIPWSPSPSGSFRSAVSRSPSPAPHRSRSSHRRRPTDELQQAMVTPFAPVQGPPPSVGPSSRPIVVNPPEVPQRIPRRSRRGSVSPSLVAPVRAVQAPEMLPSLIDGQRHHRQRAGLRLMQQAPTVYPSPLGTSSFSPPPPIVVPGPYSQPYSQPAPPGRHRHHHHHRRERDAEEGRGRTHRSSRTNQIHERSPHRRYFY